MNLDWNDVRYFLEVANSGSTASAARALGVSHPTVARRIAALEEAIGTRLFERLPNGYRLTEAASALVPAAQLMATAGARFQDAAKAESRRVQGTVRITANEFVGEHFLAPALKDFRRLYPEVTVEIMISDRFLDIANGEAEIAIRSGPRPEEGDLVVRRTSTEQFGCYCSAEYAQERGRPDSPEALAGHDVVVGAQALADAPVVQWFEAQATAAGARVACASSTFPNVAANLRAGVGIGVLGRTIAQMSPGLVPCFDAPASFNVPTWLITRADLRDAPRIRALIDYLMSYYAHWRIQLKGGGDTEPAG